MPNQVQYIIDTLQHKGFRAFVVGGCVRDMILGITPKDWDITTNALPEQVMNVFRDHNVIPTGIDHGTVTVMADGIGYEITTFRKEGKYSDNRHPDEVTFTDDLVEDLSRRDFTIGAMAFNFTEGLFDPFGGRMDLINNVIRCVGNANERFSEDALRMMRAVRFASRFGFIIDENTLDAIYKNADKIMVVSKERIMSELNQILLSNNVSYGFGLLEMSNILKYILPELNTTINVQQNNPYHNHDVFDHIIKSVIAIEPTLHLRLTALLHDIAKPLCKTTDEYGIDHFYNHPIVGSDMAVEILRRLRYDNHIIMKVRNLVLHHDAEISVNKRSIKKWLNKIGEENFRDLLKFKYADMIAQSQLAYDRKKDNLVQIEVLLNEIIADNQCFSKKDLAINGSDLIKLGFKEGKIVGRLINVLVDMVIESPELNDRERLIKIAEDELKPVI